MLAHWARLHKHPEQVVTYNVGRNINYTNVCWVKCDFCAFYRPPGSSEGYVLPNEQIFAKIDELVAFGGDEPKSCEILMQGGLNPKLRLDYYEQLLAAIRDRYPQVQLHCLSARKSSTSRTCRGCRWTRPFAACATLGWIRYRVPGLRFSTTRCAT